METEFTEIYASDDWYRARPEPEQEWQGVLNSRPEEIGPASRGGLFYILEVENEQWPVYAANMEDQFAPFVGYDVLVRGKLVDSPDSSQPELWIASLRKMEDIPQQ